MGHVAVEAEGLDDWRILFSALHARFLTGDFATGLRLVNAIGAEAEAMDHHPDLDLRYPHLNVKLTSHDVHGVTQRDVRLARRISELAAAEGVGADPSAASVLEIALDTADRAAIQPFWRAVLGLTDSPSYDEELVDLNGALPTVWFQATDPHDEPRQRFHLDLRVPPEVAEGRIAAAVAAGGVLVTDEHAPRFWVLADVEGNKACITTCQGRD
ncbi:4a-hydroxytetrahydrobiopterin dehydratase [Nocardioides sp. KIGAM211]|uniref:Putative pterin-4-alpha-carbinolamine dehydratase n=2 Tax=Nocardioides luti TaxID=2761101 RepID=A0A7X0RE64_9ACTN|nr:4a-hydroxytetrahydrobiopterin dehydratase [Nocardioides luti]MBB6626658.1 4a-hydroxytetrahydrobiopterin dehydratase [Nocardioides luti]